MSCIHVCVLVCMHVCYVCMCVCRSVRTYVIYECRSVCKYVSIVVKGSVIFSRISQMLQSGDSVCLCVYVCVRAQLTGGVAWTLMTGANDYVQGTSAVSPSLLLCIHLLPPINKFTDVIIVYVQVATTLRTNFYSNMS